MLDGIVIHSKMAEPRVRYYQIVGILTTRMGALVSMTTCCAVRRIPGPMTRQDAIRCLGEALGDDAPNEDQWNIIEATEVSRRSFYECVRVSDIPEIRETSYGRVFVRRDLPRKRTRSTAADNTPIPKRARHQ